jgi:hypothetical protein
MDLTLLKDWNGLPVGFRLVGVQDGQAELMIQRGLASAIETRSSDEANSRAGDAQRGQETTRNRKQRHKP